MIEKKGKYARWIGIKKKNTVKEDASYRRGVQKKEKKDRKAGWEI